MVKLAMMCLAAVVAVAGYLAFSGDSAHARPGYKKQFAKKYIAGNAVLAKAYGKSASCNHCHVGKKRANRNAYGQALAKLLKEKLGEKDFGVLSNKKKTAKRTAARNAAIEKFSAVLTTVEKLPSDPKEKTSATFGELIKSGKLKKTP